MPTYEIKSPDGSVYRIDAPDGKTEADALAYVKANHAKLQALPVKADDQAAKWAAPEKDTLTRDAQGQPRPGTGIMADIGAAGARAASEVGEAFNPQDPGPPTTTGRFMTGLRQAGALANYVASPIEGAATNLIGRPLAGVLPEGPQGARVTPEQIGGDVASVALMAMGGPETQGANALKTMQAPAEVAATPPITRAASNLQAKAVDIVKRRMDADAKAGGPTAQEVMDKIHSAKTEGTPLTLSDVAGENVKALAGNVARAPGPSRTAMRSFIEARDEEAGPRLTALVSKYVSSGSMRQTAQELIKSRSVEARPIWDRAMEGGSIAPLETQFEAQFQAADQAEAAARQKLAGARSAATGTAGRLATIGDNVYGQSAALPAQRAAQEAVAKAEQDLAQASQSKAAIRDRLRAAQADKTAGAKGAVWNPRIQQFLDDPVIQQGIRKGMVDQRLDALAEAKPFDPTEYAVTGSDAEGNPVIGKVPNMKLLATAKEGLDAMLEDDAARNPLTGRLTKRGVAIDKVRGAFLKELDAVNPDYKVARDQWSGKTASMDALRAGKDIFRDKSDAGALFSHTPEEIAEDFAKLSPNDREFFKIGVADTLRERILKTGFHGDEAKAVIKSPWMKAKLRPIFSNEGDFNKFIDAVTNERAMAESKARILGGSQTAERLAEDQTSRDVMTGVEVLRGAGHALSGNVLGTAAAFVRAKRDLGLRPNLPLNEEIARLLTSSDPASALSRPSGPSPGQKLLTSFPGPATQKLLGGQNALKAIGAQQMMPPQLGGPAMNPMPQQGQ